MSKRIFISYRRDDSAGHTGRVFDRLRGEFGQDALFMDVDAIPLGANFVQVLRAEVAKCDVLLAIIGPNWLDARDDNGHRRLDNPVDFVRVEIATALQRDIPVIPILLDGTRMPKPTFLPTDLQPLAERNGLDVRHASFHADMDKLVRGLKGVAMQAVTAKLLATKPTAVVNRQEFFLQEFALNTETAIAAKGRWIYDFKVDFRSSEPPAVFGHYFMRTVSNSLVGFGDVLANSQAATIAPGTIIVGDEWDETTSPMWIIKHGHTRLHANRVSASFGQLTHLGPTWQPMYAALSEAVFKKLGGKPLERFITHP
jgi:hypothetical protein